VTRVRLAWALAILTGVAAIADTVMTLESSSFFSEQAVAQHGWPFITAAVVLCSTTGAVIVSRYPRHPIGWSGTANGVAIMPDGQTAYVTDRSSKAVRVIPVDEPEDVRGAQDARSSDREE